MKLQIWYLRDVKPMYPEAHVSWSYRNEEDQARAVEEHKSLLNYPDSAHNHTDSYGKPCARALDLFELEGKTACFPKPFYVAIAKGLDPKVMLWGGHFAHLGDFDHFQLI